MPLKAASYSSSYGLQTLRERLREMVNIKDIGLPIITSGITHALSDVAALFCDDDTAVVIHGFYWENIQLLFQNVFGSTFVTYPFYNEEKEGFNFAGLYAAIVHAHENLKKEKIVVYVNFPNNPTGYNLTDQEGEILRKTLSKALEAYPNLKIVAVCDEAYFGLSYDGATKRAIMSFLVNAHPRLLTIGAKGPTKEVNVWGMRVGAVYVLPYGMNAEVIQALNEKLAGITRGLISMPATLSQEIVEKIYASTSYLENLTAIRQMMARRVQKIKNILAEPKYQEKISLFAFNAGYFCCFQVKNAEQFRKDLLALGGGVIAGCEYNDESLGGMQYIRLAFSCMPEDKIPEIMEIIYNAF